MVTSNVSEKPREPMVNRKTLNAGVRAWSDAELVAAIGQAGDRSAFEELFWRHEVGLYGLALRITGNASQAEDAVQEAMIRVWLGAKTFRVGGNARGWLFRLLARECIRILRRRKCERRVKLIGDEALESVPSALAQDAQSLKCEEAEALDALVAKLDPVERRLVALYYGGGLSQREIAESLDLTQQTVSNKLAEAMGRLRIGMKQVGFAAALPLLENDLGCALGAGVEPPPGLGAKVAAKLDAVSKASRRILAAKGGTVLYWVGITGLLAAAFVAWWVLNAKPQTSPVSPGAHLSGGATYGAKTEASSEMPPPDTQRDAALNQVWDFNVLESTKGLKVVEGQWRWLPDGGPDRSGCMETTTDLFAAEFENETPAFPTRVAVTFSPVPASGRTSEQLCSVGRSSFERAARFDGIGVPVSVVSGKWVNNQIYVTGEFTDVWAEGQRTSFLFYEKPSGRLTLLLRGRQRIDNLSIKSIRTSELPDVAQFLGVMKGIPASDRKGTVDIPELISARPGRKVSISFSRE